MPDRQLEFRRPKNSQVTRLRCEAVRIRRDDCLRIGPAVALASKAQMVAWQERKGVLLPGPFSAILHKEFILGHAALA